MRMQHQQSTNEQIVFYEIPKELCDEEAEKYEAENIFLSARRKKIWSNTIMLTKKNDQHINPVFFAFMYAMFFSTTNYNLRIQNS